MGESGRSCALCDRDIPSADKREMVVRAEAEFATAQTLCDWLITERERLRTVLIKLTEKTSA